MATSPGGPGSQSPARLDLPSVHARGRVRHAASGPRAKAARYRLRGAGGLCA
jgi:hypothetical protein